MRASLFREVPTVVPFRLSLLIVATVGSLLAAIEPPEVPREFRGVWVATVENIDWPSRRDLTTEEQQREILTILDRARQLNLNAVILQVRPACDALYPSEWEPWSAYLGGTAGRAPKPYYDPLAFAIEQAHRRGIELHAWFNPYRAQHASFHGKLPANHVVHAKPEWVRKYAGYAWLDPGEPAAVEHTLRVITDVVTRYDLDGVHIDDYFYPYPIQDESKATVPFPDADTYAARSASDQSLSLNDWRRANVDRFVQQLYQRVKEIKPSVKVGISPFGIWRPGHPPGIQGFDPYDQLYADARRWLHEGWLDYVSPQLYWPIDKPAQSYPLLLRWWQDQNGKGRHLWPGNYTSRLAAPDDPIWNPNEIVRQIELTRKQEGATGNIHFSMKAFLKDYAGINEALKADIYAEPALVPASPWLGDQPPATPSLRLDDAGPRQVVVGDSADPRPSQWVIQWLGPDGWTTHIEGGLLTTWPVPANAEQVAVSGVSRTGVQGPCAILAVKDRDRP